MPARSGLGSSSSFTVGLLNSLNALKGNIVKKSQLAKDAIYTERDILKENVGSQDQVAVAFGGFNKVAFNTDDEFRVEPITIRKERLQELSDHLMLIFTGFSRFASSLARKQIKNTSKKKKVNDFKKAFDKKLKKGTIPVISEIKKTYPLES